MRSVPALRRGGILVAVLALVLAQSTTSAGALTTWTVQAGSTATGSTTFTGATTGSSPQVFFRDITTGIAFACSSSTLRGTVPHLGSGLPNPLLTISATTFTACTGPLGTQYLIAAQGVASINGVSYADATGVSTGTLANVTWHLTSGSACGFQITGALDLSYTNSTHLLRYLPVSGSGHVLAVSGVVGGCVGIFRDGDVLQLTETTSLQTPLGALAISSP